MNPLVTNNYNQYNEQKKKDYLFSLEVGELDGWFIKFLLRGNLQKEH